MSFLRRYIFSTDHKVVAKQFLWSGLVFLLIGGLLAMAMRWQWAHPGVPVPIVGDMLFGESNGAITPASYTGLFTSHGLIMVFFAITPILIGAFGNFAIPLLIGARDMAFPRLNMLSFWLTAASQVLVLVSILMPEAPSSGWTMYAPLTSTIAVPGQGQNYMMLAILLVGVSSIMGAINYITTVLTQRAEGMTLMRMPLSIWGLFLTAVLNALFVPVLAVAAILLYLDRVYGTHFFTPAVGDPVLYQHLFWLFGHPEVYILILPVWGIIGDLFSYFARKPAYWYRGSVYAMIAVTTMSGMVYGHHLYQTGMGPLVGSAFEALTLAISAPAVILFANWLCTLWRGSIRYELPMLFAIGTLIVFAAGGLTGLYLGAISADIYLHDSLWVVGHFHLIMAAATLLGSFAAIYYWFPKMFGRMMNKRAGQVHFYGTLVFAMLTFGGMLAAGYSGQGRRLFDPFQYEFIVHLKAANFYTSYAAFCLGAMQAVFAVNFIFSMRFGKPASQNPWDAPSLEWTTESPPPQHNFEDEPVVHCGPHELGNPKVIELLGKDWLSQNEVMP